MTDDPAPEEPDPEDVDDVLARVMQMIRFLREHPELEAQLPHSAEELRQCMGELLKAESACDKAKEALAEGKAEAAEAADRLEATLEQHIASGGDPTDPLILKARRLLEDLRREAE